MDTPEQEQANPELLALAGKLGNGDAPPPGAGRGDGGGAPGAEPGAAEGAQLLALSRTIVEAVCRAAAARWPAAVYTDGEKIVMSGLLVPVFLKHVKSPWFAQWQEELSAAGYALYMGYTGWDRVRAAARGAQPVAPGDPASGPGAAL